MTATTPLEKYLAAHPGKPRSRTRRKLTFEQVARIRAALTRGSVTELARQFGISAALARSNVTELAREFGISEVAAWKIRHRITYRDLE
jgi:transposase-like protein